MSFTLRDRYLRSKYLVQKTIHDYSKKPALRAYLEIFLTLIAISLFGLFAIRPTLITIGKLLQDNKTKQDTLAVMNQKLKNLTAARDLYTKEGDKIKLIDEAIPSEPKPDNLALQVEELSKQDVVSVIHMSIDDTKILGKVDDPSKQDLNFTLSLYGYYNDLTKFARDLEKMRRPIHYDSLTITQDQGSNGTALFMTFKNLSTPFLYKQ